jgi:hypothetical protein
MIGRSMTTMKMVCFWMRLGTDTNLLEELAAVYAALTGKAHGSA